MIAAAVAAAALAVAPLSAKAEDVTLAAQHLRNDHPNVFHDLTPAAFDTAVSGLVARADELGDDELLVGLMRLAALPGVRDGHTGIFPFDPAHRRALHAYPVTLYTFADGTYVVGQSDGADLLRARFVAVNGRPLAEVLAAVRPLVPHDNESTLTLRAPAYLTTAAVLHGLHLVPDLGPVRFTFERDGRTFDADLSPLPARPGFTLNPQAITGRTPAYVARRNSTLWTSRLAGGRIFYIAYNEVRGNTYPISLRLAKAVKAKKVRGVIVDMRNNGGGNNSTYHALLSELVRVSNRKPVVVLISRVTFSAAQNFITDLERAGRPTFVGEPSGGSPNLYGDAQPTLLPASGLTLRVARRYWGNGGEDDQRLAIEPRVPVPLTSTDFFAGRDPVLAAGIAIALAPRALAVRPRFSYDRKRPLRLRLGAVTTQGGIVRQAVTFDAGRGLKPGFWTHPEGAGPWPVVLFSPGSDGNARTQLPDADRLARRGIASLTLAPPSSVISCRAAADVRAFADYVIGRRRALDVLPRLSGADTQPVAAVGFSFGAAVSAVLAGVDHRVRGAVLQSGRAHLSVPIGAYCRSAKYRRAYSVIDPVRFISRATARLLFQNGRQDPISPANDVAALVNAARAPKEQHWYDAPHELNEQARTDADDWLAALLQPRQRRTTSTWQKISPGGKTRCARGGPYSFWLRRGDPKKLLLFFQGGGGCFDQRSCAIGSMWFDDRVDANDDPRWNGGLLDFDDARNPFQDWSALYLPSCTGDVHTGTRVVKYGKVRVQQKGYFNARAGLARAYREFPDASVVFIAGCSAGSVGSAFHADSIIRHYRRARVEQLGDSLAFVFHRPISLAAWGTHGVFPPFFRIGSRRWTMTEFLTRLARAHPGVTFARFNHAADAVQQRFYAAVGANPAGFEPRLRTAERRLKLLPNYRSYLACGTNHCALPTSEFYSLRVGGVSLRDWVADLVNGRDVSCPTCG